LPTYLTLIFQDLKRVIMADTQTNNSSSGSQQETPPPPPQTTVIVSGYI